MGWRERLQRASFKGVPFFVDGTSVAQGRRVIIKRLAGGGPGSLVPLDFEDEPTEFDVTAFVWGPDYDLARNALERVLKEGGAGTLVLPTRGSMRARITRGPSTTESRTEGGYASIRFSVFLEEGDATALRAEPDTAAQLKTASAAVAAAARADVAENVRTRGLTGQQLARTAGLVQQATRVIGRATRIATVAAVPIANLTRDLDALNHAAIGAINLPSQLASTVLDLVFTAFALPQTAVQGVDRLAGVSGLATTAFGRGRAARLIDQLAAGFRAFGEPYGKQGATVRQRQAVEAEVAIGRLVRAAALSATASAYADVEFDSATFAGAALSRTIAEVDQVQLLEPPDALFASLDDLRAALARHIHDTALRLSDTVQMQVTTAVPALLLAHMLYGDARQEADIVARNRLSDPLFVEGVISVLRP